jgi:hypothetical protein
MKIVNDNSRVVNKLEASITDDDKVIIYDRHMFIVQATGVDILSQPSSLYVYPKSLWKIPNTDETVPKLFVTEKSLSGFVLSKNIGKDLQGLYHKNITDS